MTHDRPTLITGGGGMLAAALMARSVRAEADGRPPIALDRAALDVTDAEAVRAAFETHRPAIVHHCAAWTAVDAAETEPDAARAVNVDGTRNVIDAADRIGARVVHYSSDYVFGPGVEVGVPIPVDAPRAPVSVYGRTKAEAEVAVLDSAGRHLVIRTSWLFGPGGRNFVDTMVALADRDEIRVVADQTGSPTWTRDLADAALTLGAGDASGVVHVSNAGAVTWHAFALRIFERLGRGPRVTPVTTAEYGAPAPRPAWSVLDLGAAEAALGREMRPWTEALDAHLALDRH